jgi:phospholipid/cholesterol/gamma-HCH transport system permease protein
MSGDSATADSSLAAFGRYGQFCAAVARSFAAGRWGPAELWEQASTVAVRCLLPVTITAVPFGAVIAFQGMAILDLFTAQRMLSSMLAIFIVRELAPVISAVLVAAQAGSSFAAELGAMRIKEEIDATSVMSVDPIGWHVVPRVLAMALVVPLLTVLADGFGIFGGWLVAVGMEGQPHGVFMAHLAEVLTPFDLFASGFKGAAYGLMIGTIACWKGYTASGGAEGVGRAVNDTVVLSVMYILVLNYVLSSVLFGGAA